ncbi:MAG TPA: phytanoyl-CoA dioxygenase family protein [Caulobacteraceae bacterium]|jgi:ectoine hydroxylase-related dioxygenase (phytanoyl-CoA dioxygenase family)|nr:phytanoyl-CoA dioxygenase family protein [Caulobacteraceae bacterium]
MHPPEPPVRPLTAQEIEDYQRDGVACLRGVYSLRWVEHLREALDAFYARGGIAGFGVSDTFRSNAYTWMTDDAVRDFVLGAPSAWIAAQAMGSRRINFFYDQIFIKQALTPDPTPWHHDATFWPFEGQQICSLWTSVDAVDAESSALEFIAGSHRWEKRWKPVGIGGVVISTEVLEQLPDIDADRSRHNIVSWALEPGDALIFQARTVHGSRGNRSRTTGRRAIATRWLGDDVRYQPAPGQLPSIWNPGLHPGEAIGGAVFPQILPEPDAAALAARMAGPVPPDPERLDAVMDQLAAAERVPVKMDAAVPLR